jgi:hypothetical protein
MQYGYWKVRVIQKHKVPASVRHLVPGGFVLVSILLAVMSLFSKAALVLFGVLMGLYLICNLTFTVLICARVGTWGMALVLPPIFCAYHFGYGYGFLRGVIDFLVLNGRINAAFRQLTRK